MPPEEPPHTCPPGQPEITPDGPPTGLRSVGGGKPPSKKKSEAPEPLPALTLTDPSTKKLVEAQVRAMETGDPSEVLAMMRRSLAEAPPEPPSEPERPPLVVAAIPLLSIDGNPVVGNVDMLLKVTDGDPRIEIVIDGKRAVVDGRQLSRVLGSCGGMIPYGPVIGQVQRPRM